MQKKEEIITHFSLHTYTHACAQAHSHSWKSSARKISSIYLYLEKHLEKNNNRGHYSARNVMMLSPGVILSAERDRCVSLYTLWTTHFTMTEEVDLEISRRTFCENVVRAISVSTTHTFQNCWLRLLTVAIEREVV